MSTEPPVSHGRAMRRTPPKPTRTPASRSGVIRSLRSRMAAVRNENSGIAPLSAPAIPESSRAVPAAKAK